MSKDKNVVAPISGTVMNIEDVKDDVFAKKMMGDGIAIIYEGGDVYAPYDGVITAVVPSQHAVGITGDNGIEMIIHIGLETVELLNNPPFNCIVKTDDKVKQGQKLIEINEDKLLSSGFDLSSPMVILNSGEYNLVRVHDKDTRITAVQDSIFTY